MSLTYEYVNKSQIREDPHTYYFFVVSPNASILTPLFQIRTCYKTPAHLGTGRYSPIILSTYSEEKSPLHGFIFRTDHSTFPTLPDTQELKEYVDSYVLGLRKARATDIYLRQEPSPTSDTDPNPTPDPSLAALLSHDHDLYTAITGQPYPHSATLPTL